MIRSIWSKGVVLAASLLLASSAWAAEVTLAGFAFAGDFKSAAERFPHTFKLLENAKGKLGQSYSYLLNERMKGVSNKDYTFRSGDMVNLKNSDQALMAVLVLTGETVSTENFGSYHKTFVNLRGDAMIFDYKSQTIVRNYPVSVVLFDATPEKPDVARISKFVDNLMRREDGRGLITQFVRRMEAATPAREGTKTIQVRSGEVKPEALALMPEALSNNKTAANAMIADSFASILSAKTGVSMLPSKITHASGIMAMRLENGDDYAIKIGEGDYLFDVALNKFAKIKVGETSVATSHVFGAYASIRFYEPALNTTYIASDFKNGETATVPSGQVSSDDFAAYQDAIRGLYLKFADVLNGASTEQNQKWLATAASAKDINSQLSNSRNIISKCK